jgi:predicted nucleic acid-binding protein
MKLNDTFSMIKKILLDASVIKVALEKDSPFNSLAMEILKKVEMGELQAYMTSITYSEILGMQEDETLSQRVQMLLSHFPNLHLVHIDLNVAEKAADLRRRMNLSLIDSMVLSSASVVGAEAIVTCDKKQLEIPHLLYLDMKQIQEGELVGS